MNLQIDTHIHHVEAANKLFAFALNEIEKDYSLLNKLKIPLDEFIHAKNFVAKFREQIVNYQIPRHGADKACACKEATCGVQ